MMFRAWDWIGIKILDIDPSLIFKMEDYVMFENYIPAHIKGVYPYESCRLALALLSSNNATISLWPYLTANKQNGISNQLQNTKKGQNLKFLISQTVEK